MRPHAHPAHLPARMLLALPFLQALVLCSLVPVLSAQPVQSPLLASLAVASFSSLYQSRCQGKLRRSISWADIRASPWCLLQSPTLPHRCCFHCPSSAHPYVILSASPYAPGSGPCLA